MTARIYEYGLRAPTQEGARVSDQIWLAHRYRNLLCEIERRRREAVAAVLAAHPTIEPLSAAVDLLATEAEAADLAIRAARKTSRSRSDTVADRSALRDLRVRLKRARAEMRDAKRALRDDAPIQAQIAAVNEVDHCARLKARAECGVHWGSYLLIENAAIQAAKTAIKERTMPQFSAWDGNGAVGVQIQGGISVAEVHAGTDTRLQIDAVPEAAWTGTRGDRRRLGRTTLRMRVGSEGRAPIWAVWPMVMHRPLPAGAVLKGARVIRRRHGWRSRGSHDTWHLQITVVLPDEYRTEPCGTGMVAVHPGWRQVAGGLRIGYVLGDDGHERELLLDDSVAPRIASADAIHGHRDDAIEALRPALSAWLAGRDLPEWLAEQSRYLPMWRATSRFARLEARWRTERFAGDDEGYAMLDSWRRRDAHLYAYEDGRRDRALGHRREVYRRLAAELARRYEVLVLSDTDYRQLARRPRTEDERAAWDAANGQRHLAAVSTLTEACRQAFRARGGRIVTVASLDLTRTCHVCGAIVSWDQAAYVYATCACGATWDQDANAAHNSLARGREQLIADLAAEAARAKDPVVVESRWAKVKRLGREKREAARAADDNSIDVQRD